MFELTSRRIVALCMQAAILAFVFIVVSACGGGDDTADARAAASTTGRFVYTINQDSNDVSGYTIDATTGELSPIAGSPFATGVLPFQAVISPSGKFLYVAHNGVEPYAPADGSGISAYAIDRSSGALRPLPGSPFAAGSAVTVLAFGKSGDHLYALNNVSRDITDFSIDATTGVPTLAVSPTVRLGESPQEVAVDPSGRFVLVANGESDDLSVFAIDPVSALLSEVPGSPFAMGDCPYRIVFGGAGRFVYVSNANAGCTVSDQETVSAFELDAATGALAEVPGSPYMIRTTGYISTDRPGSLLFAPIRPDVAVYAIDATSGSLTLRPGSGVATGMDPTSVAIESSGNFLYLSDCADGSVRSYAITAGAQALTPIDASPVRAGACPLFVVAE